MHGVVVPAGNIGVSIQRHRRHVDGTATECCELRSLCASAHCSQVAAVWTSCIRRHSTADRRCSVLLRQEALLLDCGLALPLRAVCVETHKVVSD